MSFRNIREVLAYSYVDEIISDDEFVLLYDNYRSKNPDFSYEDSSRSDFDKLEEA
jgi:hypothetical protein